MSTVFDAHAETELRPPPKWTFFTNHSHVLILLSQKPDLTLREVAEYVGITERAVQRIVADLEDEGYIIKERVGRQNRYLIKPELALRHPIEAHCSIGDVLQLMSGAALLEK